MSRSLARRAGLALVTGSLALTGVVTAPSATAAPADRSAGWLAGQLRDGLMYNSQYDFNDYGLTADTVFALTDVGGQGRKVNAARRALADKVNPWTSPGRSVIGGSAAKALVVAEVVAKADPSDFGGVDLVDRVERLTTDSGPTVGRIVNRRAGFDTNTVGQAFAVRGLAVEGSAESPAATSFLLQQQCDAGYFRLSLGSAEDAEQGCDANGGEPDFDTTALAVLNLQAVPDADPTVQAAVTSALDWMQEQQRDNGSFRGSGPTAVPNTNSTGLAAWALGQDQRCRAAARAAQWVKGLRLDNGAIAYDKESLRTARRKGITESTRDTFRRATTQAAPGLTYAKKRFCRL